MSQTLALLWRTIHLGCIGVDTHFAGASRAFMLDQTFLHSDTTSSCRPGLSRKAKALVGNNAARRILATP